MDKDPVKYHVHSLSSRGSDVNPSDSSSCHVTSAARRQIDKNFGVYSTLQLCALVVSVPDCKLRGSGVDFRRYQTFCVPVGLERGTFSLVRITEELYERKNRGSGLEN
jgi:hypothetical protein